MAKKITLFLVRGEEKQEIIVKLSAWAMSKSVGKLKRLNKQGWRLVDVEGDNPKVVEFMKRQIQDYEANPKNYSPPIKETIKVGAGMMKPSLRRKKQ